MEITRLSTKGQIVLPKHIRVTRAWRPGTKFAIEESGEGILLRPAESFAKSDLAEVAGCLRSRRKPETPSQTRTPIPREVKRPCAAIA